jgi:hypothetical protein
MSDLDDLIDSTQPEDAAGRFQRRLIEEQRAHAVTRRAAAKAETRIAELEQLMDRFAAVKPADMVVPKWLKPKAPSRRIHHATALLLLSDLHLDEVVDRYEMGGINEYNREIAEQRLERVVEGVVTMTSRHVAGVKFDGLVVALNGDILTGDIHHELALTNEAPAPASIAFWVPRLASALTYLADHFGRVHVPCTSGNHDRDPNKRRTPMKQREESSLAWIIYNWLADMLRDDPRITFSITTSPGQVYPIYGTTFHQIHGDGFRSAGGIGGIFPSLLKYLHRIDSLYATQGTNIDCHLLGHWHQYLTGPNWIITGSLKGYDEYAKSLGFGFEKPRMALAIVTPELGITQQMPIYA